MQLREVMRDIGLLRGMALLKLTTGDDVFIELTNANTKEELKYATNINMMFRKILPNIQRKILLSSAHQTCREIE